ncbi:MAG: tyrosine-type recombinase/integrase [Saprospiraceae bacterium]
MQKKINCFTIVLPHKQQFLMWRIPTNRYKLKWEKTTKVYLTEMELKTFEKIEVNPKHKISIHKDVFIFACYTGGLRISDICRLKWIHFNGTHIIIDTYKTNSTVTIKLPDKSLELIEKYKVEGQRPSDYIFPLLDSGKDYENSDKLSDAINGKNAYANKSLLIIAKKLELKNELVFIQVVILGQQEH